MTLVFFYQKLHISQIKMFIFKRINIIKQYNMFFIDRLSLEVYHFYLLFVIIKPSTRRVFYESYRSRKL